MFSFLLIALGIVCMLTALAPCMGQRSGASRAPRRVCAHKNSSGMVPVLVLILGGAGALGLWSRSRSLAPELKPLPTTTDKKVEETRNNFPPFRRMPIIARTSGKPKPDQPPSWTVVGTGVSRAEAEQDALERGQAEVINYLGGLTPPVEWTPPLDYVGQYLVKDRQELPPKKVERCAEFPTGEVPQFSLRVEVTPEVQADIARLDRQEHREERLPWLARILAGLVALLVAVSGYVRLDEWSKGYYTGWLRLAAVALVGVSGLGLWFLH